MAAGRPPRRAPGSLRIRGLVRLQRTLRESAARGLTAAEVAAFRRDVPRAVAFVEEACRERGLRPDDLPAPTRAAWRFLRDFDLEGLAPAAADTAPAAPPKLRVPHLSAAVDALTERLSAFAAGRTPDGVDVEALRSEAALIARRTRRVVAEAGGEPALSLAGPSRQALATAAFLADPERLAAAVAAVRALHAADRAAAGGGAPDPPLVVQPSAMSALYRARRDRGALWLRLNLGFVDAPPALLARIVRAVRGSGRREGEGDREAWDRWSRGEAFAAVVAELDALIGGAQHRPRGRAHDLEEIYRELDATFFRGALERPALAWSATPARRRLGRYVAALDRIELSAVLDDPAVPREVVAWVLYHELLHKVVPGRWEAGRLIVHPPAFRERERRFPDWQRWERWLRRFLA